MGEWRWPRWFPLYSVAVIVLTLTPFWPTCDSRPLVLSLHPFDALQNLLLFVPFGLALRGLPLAFAVGLAVLFSGALEFAQTQLPRTPNAFDVVTNGLGAALGHSAAGRLVWLRFGPRWIHVWGAASLLAALAVGLLATRGIPNDFRNWSAHPLRVGLQVAGGDDWRGELRELQLFDRAVEPGELHWSGTPPAWKAGGPLLWLRFGDPLAGRIDGPSGPRRLSTPLGVQRGWAPPEAVANEISKRLVASGELSVAARLLPAVPAPQHRASIVALASGPIRHSFTFEQHRRDLALRVSTANDDVNPWQTELRAALAPGSGEREVVAAFHGPFARFYADGVCAAEVFYPLEFRSWPFAGGIAASILLCTLGPGLWIATLLASRSRALAALGGTGICVGFWLALRWAGSWAHLPEYDATALALAAAGWLAAVPYWTRTSTRPVRSAALRSP
jgi:VanZ family protein